MGLKKITENVAPGTDVVGDAVGMEKSYWFVAIVNHNTEKAVAEKLEKIGIDVYLPIQREYRIWKNGRRASFDRVVIPSIVFIYCTEFKRKEIVALPFINRFMVNKAGSSVNKVSKPIATIPSNQIDRLRFMLGQSDIPVTITEKPYKCGDKVKVIRGTLAGLEGEVCDMNADKSELIVTLSHLGCARLSIDNINLEIIPS